MVLIALHTAKGMNVSKIVLDVVYGPYSTEYGKRYELIKIVLDVVYGPYSTAYGKRYENVPVSLQLVKACDVTVDVCIILLGCIYTVRCR